ncbi:2,3-bisphosphoglycerate-dependent phosphoglycerate mutase [Fructilactobacillus florum]|uniref:2,3-bisphosphoglycerate-dependent phosphoglycerate mutase n=1 Tax=Fructilactobacillus florum TaxID=640331 RepID=UPI00028EEA62|nr:2,3-diphosphoglycerate-dependent phosphoglycerate mutase [Fructilactobacillus florum]EKK20065.1 Phosphoglycerate mutase [Fructilactobacillus florum 2F]
MSRLVLVRHGESTANYTKTFTGWSDVALTERGRAAAFTAGQKLGRLQIQFKAAHTSYLKRAIESENLILEAIHQLEIPQYKTWRLNERHYGALRGQKKATVRQAVGDWQFQQWRRSYAAVPPQLDQVPRLRRYQMAGIREPRAESLKMASDRLLPYWQDQLAPRLRAGQDQLVVAHGSSLRALVKWIEEISDCGIDGVEVLNAVPIVYTFDPQLQILDKQILS